MSNSDSTSQEDQYRELLAVAFGTKEHSDDKVPSDQLLQVLELLTSPEDTDPEQRFAAWLKHAL